MKELQANMPCPVCKNAESKVLVRMQNMPVFCNVLRQSVEEAQAVIRGDIELVLCDHCSHIYNRQFNPAIVRYQPGYENSLHFSKRYRSYAAQQVERLLDTYNLSGQGIIDIGCGKGEFLQLFTRLGNCTGTGFEPTADPLEERDLSDIIIVSDTFTEHYFDIPAKCYASRHVLEHLSDPVPFLKTIRQAMNGKDALLFLEIPDGAYMLEQCSIWDVIYEHYTYFTPLSLRYLLEHTGFHCGEIQSGFGGQYLFVDAFPQAEGNVAISSGEEMAENAIFRMAEEFALCSGKRYEKVEELIGTELQCGRKIVLWGAGSKGVTLLNQLPDPGIIQYVVDINPGKQGKYIPGSGQLVVSPEFLDTFHPDTVLIMNDMYRREIQDCLDSLNLSARIHSL